LMANVGDSLGSRKSGFRHNGKRFTGLPWCVDRDL
jgi:hypothetical protein